jgi:hypothetical protein
MNAGNESVQANPVKAETRDSNLKSLYYFGGTMALVALTANVLDVVLGFGGSEVIVNGTRTALEWFALFQESWFRGLYILGILNIIYMICMVPVYFAIFAAHSNTKKIYASLAMIIFFVSMAIYISSSAAIPMYVLSGRYAAAQTESQRAFFAAAGEAVLVRGEDFTPGSFIGLIFGGVAALDMSLVMLRGGVFGKGTAWVGIIGFSSLSMFTICATFIPALYFVAFYGFGTIGGLLALLWFVLVARRLFQLGRQSNPA